jgi:hypothetical protein
MSVKTFVGAAKKEDAEKALEKRPVLVLFYMIGCPHCEANKPAWDELKKERPDDEFVEVEADATPENEGVSGFPTMKYKKEDGSEKVTSGKKSSAKEIADELELEGKKGSSRRRALRRTNRRRNRKLRHSTLRNHVSFRQKLVRSRALA